MLLGGMLRGLCMELGVWLCRWRDWRDFDELGESVHGRYACCLRKGRDIRDSSCNAVNRIRIGR